MAERPDRELAESAGGVLQPGPYAAAVGQELVYALTVASEVELRRGDGPATVAAMDIDGTMQLTVLACDPVAGEVVVGYRFPETTLRTQGKEAPAFDEDWEVRVRMGRRGEVLGVRFPEPGAPQRRQLLRSLLSSLQFVVDYDVDRWAADEVDVNGISQVHYRWGSDGEVLHKQKSAASNQDGVAFAMEGSGRAVFATGAGWFDSLRFAERGSIEQEAFGLASSARGETAVELVASRLHAPSELPPVQWEGPWEPLEGTADFDRSAEERSLRAYARLRESETVASIVGKIVGLAGGGQHSSYELYECGNELALLLRHEPESLGLLERTLRELAHDPNLARRLLAAVGAVGTEECEELLRNFLREERAPTALRAAAAHGMFMLTTPTPAVHDLLVETVRSTDSSRALISKSLLVLGSLIPRFGSEAACREALDSLAGLEQRAAELELSGAWLSALGNAGGDEILPLLEPYLTHAAAFLRFEAVSSLRKLTPVDAVPRLIDAVADEDPRVRREAARLLALRTDATALDAVDRLLREEADPTVRLKALRSLMVRVREDPAAHELVERSSREDASDELRAAVTRALTESG